MKKRANMASYIAKLRKEAEHHYNAQYNKVNPSWRAVILESIFRPPAVVKGKEPMSHLHPDIKKLHLPHGMYIADWRKYRWEDHPALVEFQKRCHSAGLHDPWLRNYAFNFYPNRSSFKSRMAVITYQLSWGFTAAVVLFAAQKAYVHFFPIEYEHTKFYKEHHAAAAHGDHH